MQDDDSFSNINAVDLLKMKSLVKKVNGHVVDDRRTRATDGDNDNDDDDDVKNSSDDENDIEDETMSGENDVEYAEFSMSLFIPPKEQQLNKSTSEILASKRLQKTNNKTQSGNINGGLCNPVTSTIDDDLMILSLNSIQNTGANSNHNSIPPSISCMFTQCKISLKQTKILFHFYPFS